MKKYVYFRNDDVNTLEKELIDITNIFINNSIPIIHAVEPANVTEEAVDYLVRIKERNPEIIEIMQHGFDHICRDQGEFGGKRPYDDQLKDLSKGKEIMESRFGKHFQKA